MSANIATSIKKRNVKVLNRVILAIVIFTSATIDSSSAIDLSSTIDSSSAIYSYAASPSSKSIVSLEPSTTLDFSDVTESIHFFSQLYTINSTATAISSTNIIVSEDSSNKNIAAIVERSVIDEIMSSFELMDIQRDKDPDSAVVRLQEVTISGSTTPAVSTFLLGHITQMLINATFNESTLNSIININNYVLQSVFLNGSTTSLLIASSLVVAMDSIVLHYIPDSRRFARMNIEVSVTIIDLSVSELPDPIIAINTSTLSGTSTANGGPEISLVLPLELLRQAATACGGRLLRIGSTLYRNALLAFSGGCGLNTLVSDVVGTSLICENDKCPLNTSLLITNVTVIFEHSLDLQKTLISGGGDTQCVLLDIIKYTSIWSLGNWSGKGCFKSYRESSTTRTVCHCNYLTHFAILLSDSPPHLSASVSLGLQVIDYVGVPISVVALVITVIFFTAWNISLKDKPILIIRNYIHNNLCINLVVSHITFLAGINRSRPIGGIPPHCQAIAVILHYFYLVYFMWMLMEGVALYLALVKLFVTEHRKYIAFLTFLSYGLPLLYIGALTLPLGYGMITTGPNYGYNYACFLNPKTHFDWAFIAPVIIIFLINICFFVMAVKISWTQNIKRSAKKTWNKFSRWLCSALSLSIILGLTWIMGLLIVDGALLPLLYINEILVSFHGFLIFIVLVVLSRPVQDWVKKSCKTKFKRRSMQAPTQKPITCYTNKTKLNTSKLSPSNSVNIRISSEQIMIDRDKSSSNES